MKSINKKVITLLSAISISVASSAALADYPDKPIKVIVPYGAGGDSDLTTRVWADAVEKELGVPIIVINKKGAGGIVGTSFVANSKNDGYTLINAGLGNMLVTPNFSKTPYDFSSFQPILKMTAVPLGIVVSKDSPYKNFEDFIAGAKAKTLTQGSWGAASSGTILANIIADQAGYKPKYVHGNTTAESMVSVIGGHIDSAVSFPPAFAPHVKADRARLLVINQKMDTYPGVPTFSDFGIKGSFEGWSGIFAPKGVPQEVVDKLIAATTKAMQDPKVLKAYENMGAIVNFRHGEKWVSDMQETYQIMKSASEKVKK
ncbi:tripartite tricarboxylate transporter substrate binding protein [Gammaproteobacteria bacterium AS21]